MKCANETECCHVSRTSASAGEGARRDTKHGERQQHQNVGRNWTYRMVSKGGDGIKSVCKVCESKDERCSNSL